MLSSSGGVSIDRDPGFTQNAPLGKNFTAAPYFTGFASMATFTFTQNGKPLAGAQVQESNTNGSGTTVQNPGTAVTKPDGTMLDVIGKGVTTPTPSVTDAQANQGEQTLMSTPFTSTSTQTLTFTFTGTSGQQCTCQTSSTRTITNTDSSGHVSNTNNANGNNVTVTTTQPTPPKPVDKKPK